MPLKPLFPTANFTYLLFLANDVHWYADGALTLFVYRAINRTSELDAVHLHTSTDVCPPVATVLPLLESVAYVWPFSGYPSRVWDPITFLYDALSRTGAYGQA